MLDYFPCAPLLNPVGFGKRNVGPFFFKSGEIILDCLFLGPLFLAWSLTCTTTRYLQWNTRGCCFTLKVRLPVWNGTEVRSTNGDSAPVSKPVSEIRKTSMKPWRESHSGSTAGMFSHPDPFFDFNLLSFPLCHFQKNCLKIFARCVHFFMWPKFI